MLKGYRHGLNLCCLISLFSLTLTLLASDIDCISHETHVLAVEIKN